MTRKLGWLISSLGCAMALAVTSAQAGTGATQEIYKQNPRVPKDLGFVDFELQIESQRCPNWDDCTVQARGTFNSTPVGLAVDIRKLGGNQTGITYRSIGRESDNLLAAMSTLYKLKPSTGAFRQQSTRT